MPIYIKYILYQIPFDMQSISIPRVNQLINDVPD